jgi:nucleoside-diphosphate-sugar epimerase
MAVREHCLPAFTDADGRFQFVYVKDAAQAILNCLGNEETYAQAYNLSGEETLDYCLFFETLRKLADQAQDGGCRVLPMSLAEAQALGVPVPFPATAAETELVSNRKSREELSLSYTPLGEGMQKTFTAFRHVYE